MKAYRNSIYIFLVFVLVSLILVCFSPEEYKSLKSIFLGIFTSSLIALFSAMIFYFYEKQKIIISVGIKSVRIYGGLIWLMKELEMESNIYKKMPQLINSCNFLNNILRQNILGNDLINYSGALNRCPLCWSFSEDIKRVSSLWTIDENLINGFSRIIVDLEKIYSEYNGCIVKNDLEKIMEKEKQAFDFIKKIKIAVAKNLIFMDEMIEFLFTYNLFNGTWSDTKDKLNFGIFKEKETFSK